MKLAALTVLQMLIIVGLAATGPQAQDKPTPAPIQKVEPKEEKAPAPLTLEQREQYEALQKKSLEYYIQIQNIQKKYDDMRNADPQYQDLTKRNEEATKSLTTLDAEVKKGVDLSKWQINYDDLKWTPIQQAKPPEGKKP